MSKSLLWAALVLSMQATGFQVRAAEPPAADKADAKPAEEEPKAAATAPAAPLQAIVHGLFMQMRTGMGYMVMGSTIPPNPVFPLLSGQPEQLGGGALVDVAFGVELNDLIALQLVGGLNLVAGRRVDRVRALNVAYGGAGVRISLPINERLTVTLAPAIGYGRSDTVVEAPTTGLLIQASVGLEYYVHLRHFSVGVDLSGVAPLTPRRVFLGLAPHLRYTF